MHTSLHLRKKSKKVNTAELCGSSSSAAFQNYKFNFATENSEQLLSVFVSGSVVMKVILNTTFVLWLTAQSVYCTLLQPGCTIIFNGLDLHSVLDSKRHSWRIRVGPERMIIFKLIISLLSLHCIFTRIYI